MQLSAAQRRNIDSPGRKSGVTRIEVRVPLGTALVSAEAGRLCRPVGTRTVLAALPALTCWAN